MFNLNYYYYYYFLLIYIGMNSFSGNLSEKGSNELSSDSDRNLFELDSQYLGNRKRKLINFNE